MKRSRSTLIVLVGPKGAGKSTIGRALQAQYGFRFVDVEAIAKTILAARGGVIDEDYAQAAFAATLAELQRLGREHPMLVMETTGASDSTMSYLEALAAQHRLMLVRVSAGEAVCRSRIAERDAAAHAPVPAGLIAEMHRRSEALQLNYALELCNEDGVDLDRLVQAFGPLVGRQP